MIRETGLLMMRGTHLLQKGCLTFLVVVLQALVPPTQIIRFCASLVAPCQTMPVMLYPLIALETNYIHACMLCPGMSATIPNAFDYYIHLILLSNKLTPIGKTEMKWILILNPCPPPMMVILKLILLSIVLTASYTLLMVT